jgi:hypothetical protein
MSTLRGDVDLTSVMRLGNSANVEDGLISFRRGPLPTIP